MVIKKNIKEKSLKEKHLLRIIITASFWKLGLIRSLKAINCFCKIAPSWIINMVQNIPLIFHYLYDMIR